MMSNAERQARWRKSMAEKGYVPVTIWVPRGETDRAKEIIRREILAPLEGSLAQYDDHVGKLTERRNHDSDSS